jgi:hypothetical protein
MDAVSHVLMGGILAAHSPTGLTPSSFLLYGAMSLAPDLWFVPLGLKLGRDRGRRWWIPRAADWQGARARYPLWVALSWDLPYSLLANLLVAAVAGAPWLLLPYWLHIVVDYGTHTGEWANRPFFPLSACALPARTSAWEWPLRRMAVAWAVLAAMLFLLR